MADRQTRESPARSAEFFSAWNSSESTKAERLAIEDLQQVAWAKQLLAKLEAARLSGDRRQQRAYAWEVRVAHSIHRLGYQAHYECRARETEKSVDFRVLSQPELLIEAISIQNSDASELAGWVEERAPGFHMYGINLTSANPDQRQTAAGEMVHLIEKLTEKAAKFPSPRPGVYHLIVADIRGYCAGMVDPDDCNQIAFGPEAVRSNLNVEFFENAPVQGIFDSRNTRPNSVCCQQRVHAVGLFGGRRNGSLDVLSTRVSVYKANSLLSEQEADQIAELLDVGLNRK